MQCRTAMLVGQIIIFIILAIAMLTMIANFAVFRSLPPAKVPDEAPMISVLVPARNEALNIEACVASLLSQEYPNYELIVLDDHSTDGTGEKVSALFAAHPSKKTRLMRGTELPEGWTGKGWACHQLAGAASGQFLFFTDADTTHSPGLLAAAVGYARKHRISLLSAWPRFITVTIGEKLVVPTLAIIGMTMAHHWLVALLQRFPAVARRLGARWTRPLGAANGQFMFFTREAYDQIGGHAAVRSHVVEDVALGREIAARMGEGMRLVNCDSVRFSTVRMYRSFAESWAGFSKNLRAAFDRERTLFWLFLASLLFVWLIPSVAWLDARLGKIALWNAVLVWSMRVIVTWRMRLAWSSAILHPAAILVFMGIAINSWRLSHGRGVEWKGRTYRPDV
ncbi:MAG: hypothetical protein RL088_2037 [Verrucomicrobiota bacterium]